jgi:hypothetical protein
MAVDVVARAEVDQPLRVVRRVLCARACVRACVRMRACVRTRAWRRDDVVRYESHVRRAGRGGKRHVAQLHRCKAQRAALQRRGTACRVWLQRLRANATRTGCHGATASVGEQRLSAMRCGAHHGATGAPRCNGARHNGCNTVPRVESWCNGVHHGATGCRHGDARCNTVQRGGTARTMQRSATRGR